MRILAIAPTSFFADYGCHVRIRGQLGALAAHAATRSCWSPTPAGAMWTDCPRGAPLAGRRAYPGRLFPPQARPRCRPRPHCVGRRAPFPARRASRLPPRRGLDRIHHRRASCTAPASSTSREASPPRCSTIALSRRVLPGCACCGRWSDGSTGARPASLPARATGPRCWRVPSPSARPHRRRAGQRRSVPFPAARRVHGGGAGRAASSDCASPRAHG